MGLRRLYSLRLDRTPAADKIAETIQTWAESMVRHLGPCPNPDIDKIRIIEGFHGLVDSVTSWPSPAQLYARMPPRSENRFHSEKRMKAGQERVLIDSMTEAERRIEGKKSLRMIQDLLRGKVVNDGVIPNEKARHLQVVRDKKL